MDYRALGASGLHISAIGLGCNPFGNEVDEAGAAAIVNRALDLGVTYFDTADSYFEGRSEQYLGAALKGQRHRAVIATKTGNATGRGPNDAGASRQHIIEAVHASLGRLQTDYIDVYQIHTPDRATPIEETMRALDDLVRQGTVRYIGCSNFFEWEVCEAIWTARLHHLTPFVSCQEFYNLLYRDVEKRMAPFCQAYGLGLIPYFPLAGGLLSGTYRRGLAPPAGTRGARRPSFATWDSDRNWTVREALSDFADRRGYALSQLALAWLLTRPAVCTVIAGADTVAHIEANARSLEIHLSADDLAELDRITLVDEDRTVAPVLRVTRRPANG
jgi:aryl-alcohol dehydrogenase-like predicted oxidoreductase